MTKIPDTESKMLVGDRYQNFSQFRCDYCDKVVRLRVDVGFRANDCGCGLGSMFEKEFLGGNKDGR